jgi:hypothetical protein
MIFKPATLLLLVIIVILLAELNMNLGQLARAMPH